MATQIDVYRDWLGIAETARPLNYYQVLRLPQFEDDPAKVRAHYRKLNAHVRKYAAGEYAKQSQELLNELAKAMLCLTDRKRKGEYDASIGRAQPGKERRFTFEQILLGRKIVDAEQLKKARDYADALNLEVRDALVQQKMATQDVVMQAYAESLGLPFVDVADVGVRVDLVPQVPAVLARQHSCAPIMVDDGQLLMASPNPLPPDVEEELRLRVSMPVRSVICTPAAINAVINQHFPREAAAAQMAKGAAVSAAEKSAAAKGEASAQLTPEEREEQKKQRRNLSIVAFNFTFMAVFGACQILLMKNAMLLGLAFAVPAAATVAMLVYMLKK
ncbi:MAG: hypothetical protein K1X74_01310 [Pirellulales bacterium]|nr:hypothetical protein [Pirellulales bacterium]